LPHARHVPRTALQDRPRSERGMGVQARGQDAAGDARRAAGRSAGLTPPAALRLPGAARSRTLSGNPRTMRPALRRSVLATPVHPDIARIRTLALVGQTTSGKTSLVEALLVRAGAIGAPGSLERGTTVCDF